MDGSTKTKTATEMAKEREGQNTAKNTIKKHKNTEIVIASWNAQGLHREGKIKQLIEEARRYNIDILATQETNIKGETITKIKDFVWLNGGGGESRYGTNKRMNKRENNGLGKNKRKNKSIKNKRTVQENEYNKHICPNRNNGRRTERNILR